MPFDWAAAEDAIRQWLMIGSGYPDQRVIHLNTNGNRPTEDYLGFALDALRPIGIDDVNSAYDSARPAGSEIEIEVTGQRESALEVQAYSRSTSAGITARAVLSRVQTVLGLPTVREALAAAGVVVFDHGTVSSLPGVRNGEIEGRAVLSARIYCVDDAAERTTYIEHVFVLDEDTGNVIEIDA